MEERTSSLDALLRAAARRQLSLPLLLWLAGHRPLAFFAGQTLLAVTPIAALLGWPQAGAWAGLLSEPDALSRMQRVLERHAQDGMEPHVLE